MKRTPYTIARAHLLAFRFYSKKHRNPYTVLRDLDLLEFALERVRASLVAKLRADGAPWHEVGDALGLTADAARHRYGG